MWKYTLIFLGLWLGGASAAVATDPMNSSKQARILSQIDHSDFSQVLIALRELNITPDIESAHRRMSNEDFISNFGMSKETVRRLSQSKQRMIVKRSISRIINGQLLINESYYDFLIDELENYFAFVHDHRAKNWNGGGASDEYLFDLLKTLKWPLWNEYFGSIAHLNDNLDDTKNKQGYNVLLKEELDKLSPVASIAITDFNIDPRTYAVKRKKYLVQQRARGDLAFPPDEPASFVLEPMSFRIVKSPSISPEIDERLEQAGMELRWIFGEGRIVPETAKTFTKFVKEVCGSLSECDFSSKGIHTITLNSQGGDLAAGIELGRLIRQLRLSTAVSSAEEERDGHIATRGRCFSACAYAFMGGVHRRLEFTYEADHEPSNDDGIIGLHRYSDSIQGADKEVKRLEAESLNSGMMETCSFESEIEIGQCINRILIEYLDEMGVDSGKVFSLASLYPNDEIHSVDKDKARRLGVINDQALTNWHIIRSGVGFSAAATNPDPNGGLLRISAYCLSIDGKFRRFLELMHTKTEDYSQNPSAHWAVTINGNTIVTAPEAVKYWNDRISLELNDSFWIDLLEQDNLKLSLSPIVGAGSESNWPLAESILNKRDISNIHWAMKSCL
ncbi:MAG: hypothetical protein AAF984_11105 [Verrucomicrobiota bacterium]